MMPKVRVLLERQYPQLTTARLEDGSHVKYAEWNRQAAGDREALARLRREQQKLERSLADVSEQLGAAQARVRSLQDQAEDGRKEARAAARSEQERQFAELRASVERSDQEHARQIQLLAEHLGKVVVHLHHREAVCPVNRLTPRLINPRSWSARIIRFTDGADRRNTVT
jgi:septal ring factor EnvC (AmiA/AmiB activator)